jgi:hypothetical protein
MYVLNNIPQLFSSHVEMYVYFSYMKREKRKETSSCCSGNSDLIKIFHFFLQVLPSNGTPSEKAPKSVWGTPARPAAAVTD